MTLEKNHPQREATQGMPAPEELPSGPRTAVSAAVARRLPVRPRPSHHQEGVR